MNAYTPSATSEISSTVKNGIFYTPENVALELVRGARQYFDVSSPLSILDPACGDGALLRASKQELGPWHTFYGYDLFPPDCQRWAEGMRFCQGDFFDRELDAKFDLVITNPPYIQFGRMDALLRSSLHVRFSKQIPLRGTVDLWVYFLIKSVFQLREGGTIAAVIPWSFLEADFSHNFRSWLADRFEHIRVLVLRDRHFGTTEKRVLLLWMGGHGRSMRSIELGFSEHIDDAHAFQTLTREEWAGSRLLTDVDVNAEVILEKCCKKGWFELQSISKISIGVVTGANDFFVRKTGAYSNCRSVPILTKVDDLQSLEVLSLPEKELLFLDSQDETNKQYIDDGIRSGVNKRSHCLRRGVKWYEVNAGAPPDAFFTYRVASIPYLSLNPMGYHCTNTLHKVTFVESLTESKKMWIALCLLTDISQLSLELNGRHYGNGVLKIEPSALKAALVTIPGKKVSRARFNMISGLICSGRKEEAAKEATIYLKEVSNVPLHLWAKARTALNKIRARRK